MLLILREEILCFIVLLLVAVYYANNKIKDDDKKFWYLISCSIMYVIFDGITLYTINTPSLVHTWINTTAHYIFYILGVLVGLCFYTFTIKVCAIYEYEKVLRLIGFAMVGVYTLIMWFIPFDYVQGNGIMYSSGPLVYITYALFLNYCVLGILFMLVFKSRIDARTQSVIYFMIVPLCAFIIVLVIIPELLMTGACAVVICLGVFISLDNPDKKYKQLALRDYLTGLKNRNCYERDRRMYEERIKRSRKKSIGVIVADLNNLKKINDDYGHIEGDNFINEAANVLKVSLVSADSIYRVCGDEFIAIYVNPDSDKVHDELNKIREICETIDQFPVPLDIALGYHCGNIVSSIDDIIDIADQNMYNNKRELKQKRAKMGCMEIHSEVI